MKRRMFMTLSMTTGLVACGPRGVFMPATPAENAATQTVFVATDRSVDEGLMTTGGRDDYLSFGRVDVSIPPSHQIGQIEYPLPKKDNSQKFGVNSAVRYKTDTDLLGKMAKIGARSDDIVIYVHGYNNTLAEAVYRHAQIAHDFGMTGPQLTFSWTSAAEPLGYAYDQNSVTIARDRLERLIVSLATKQRRRIVLLAHSMGSWLVTEVLRQMSIAGRTHIFDRIATVALMSPDIDVDVFQSQIDRIRPLPQPFVVFVSQQDRALQFSARLSGKSERLGSIADITQLQSMGITVVDLTAFSDGDLGDHIVAASSPTAIAMLRGIQANGVPKDVAVNRDISLPEVIFEALPG